MGIAEKKPDTLSAIHGEQAKHYEQQVRLLMAGELPTDWQWVSCSRDTAVAVSTAGPLVYYKEFLPRDRFEQIKALFRGNRCERACRQAGVLVTAGLPTPEILCWGNGRKNAFLITKDFDGIGFYQYLKAHFSPPLSQEQIREKRLMLAKAGALIGRMHSKGIVHGDLRQNNLLVKQEGKDFRFSFIDNESNRKWRHIPLSRVVKNLVQFAIYPDNILSGPDLMRLFKAYSANYPRFPARNRQKLLQTVFLRSKARILESRLNWECKNFCRPFRADRFSGQFVLDTILAKQIASRADFGQWFQSADVTMKHDKSITVKLLHGPAGDIVVKRFSAKNLLYHLKVWGKKERIFQLWKMTHYFQFLGIPVAPAMGYVLEGTGAWRTVSYFCSHYLENTSNLLELSRNRKIFPVLLNDKQIISRVAGALARLHNNGFCHGDTKWANVLVHPDTGEFWFIDLDGASPVTSILGHGVCKDLSRFLVNIIEHRLPEGYADEFLSAYCRTRRLNKELVQMTIKPSIEKILSRHKKHKKI
ncbi:MAG: phosphotransferase [Proteobacteria bacterium]|nr:phosphotransferase [Pseudomonadota bacterium]